MSAFSGSSYTALLAAGVHAGLAGLSPGAREAHVQTVLAFRRGDGGFAGRSGGTDLYYTAFGARALHALGRLEGDPARSLLAGLTGREPVNIVDQASWLSAAFLAGGDSPDPREVLGFAERFRAHDGGYAKRAGGSEGSTYHSFLACLCCDLLGLRPPEPEALAAFVLARRRADGGFCETSAAVASSTNVTAAGLTLLLLLGSPDRRMVGDAAGFLRSMRTASGGWLATKGAPVPDLLSTHAAVTALQSVGALDEVWLRGAQEFAARCSVPDGGYRAGPWDDRPDVEYTYYGLALQAPPAERII